MSTDPAATEPVPEGPPPRWVTVVGLLVACAAALLFAILGAFLTPFRIGTVLVPVSLVIAVAAPIAFTRFAQDVTGHRWLSLIPGGVWLIATVPLSGRTAEGDLVLTQQSWVPIAYPLVGAATLAVLAYWAVRDVFRNVGGAGP